MTLRLSSSPMLDAIAAKVTTGERLSTSDVQSLTSVSDIVGLGMLGEAARRRRHGDRITYLRVVHASVTQEAGTSPFPQTAGEIRLEGAAQSIDDAAAAVTSVVGRAGNIPVVAFSLTQLDGLARRSGVSLAVCLARLKAVGLEGVADASLDEPGFDAAFETAVALGLRLSRIGFERADESWVERVQRLVRLQDASPSVTALSPLPRRLNAAAPTTGYADLKRVAIARLAADNVQTIQIDWSAYGPKLAQVALTFGADDLDDVPAVDDLSLGTRRAPLEEVRRNILAAGLVPVERNGRWVLAR